MSAPFPDESPPAMPGPTRPSPCIILIGMAGAGKATLTSLALIKVAVVISAMVIAHWLMRNTKVLHVAHNLSWWKLGTVWAALILLLIWAQECGSSFIYFQF